MEGPVSFWGYKEQESNLILPEHDDDDDDDDIYRMIYIIYRIWFSYIINYMSLNSNVFCVLTVLQLTYHHTSTYNDIWIRRQNCPKYW